MFKITPEHEERMRVATNELFTGMQNWHAKVLSVYRDAIAEHMDEGDKKEGALALIDVLIEAYTP